MVHTFCNFRETEYMQYSEKQLRFAGTNEWSQTQYIVIMPTVHCRSIGKLKKKQLWFENIQKAFNDARLITEYVIHKDLLNVAFYS